MPSHIPFNHLHSLKSHHRHSHSHHMHPKRGSDFFGFAANMTRMPASHPRQFARRNETAPAAASGGKEDILSFGYFVPALIIGICCVAMSVVYFYLKYTGRLPGSKQYGHSSYRKPKPSLYLIQSIQSISGPLSTQRANRGDLFAQLSSAENLRAAGIRREDLNNWGTGPRLAPEDDPENMEYYLSRARAHVKEQERLKAERERREREANGSESAVGSRVGSPPPSYRSRSRSEGSESGSEDQTVEISTTAGTSRSSIDPCMVPIPPSPAVATNRSTASLPRRPPPSISLNGIEPKVDC